jgi:type IV secretion system protein VirB3
MADNTFSYPLFKGATRVPIFLGVPTVPLGIASIAVAAIAMHFIWAWILLIPVVLILQQITKNDDRVFRLWGLYIDTTLRNRFKRVWSASSYSTVAYKKRNIT